MTAHSALRTPHSALQIVGHQKRWAALARAFGKGQVPQSLLISGAPQVGKETLARRFAQLLLCQTVANGPDGLPAPCGHCKICHQVAIETYPDYRAYRPLVASAKDEKDFVFAPDILEGSIHTVEVARRFGDEAMRRPVAGTRKVMLLVQADRMNTEAQNALLKTFEEPVRGLCIVLMAENPSHLLPTVRSRCWHLPLGLAADAEIQNWLAGQFPSVPEKNLREAVRVGGGRPGAAWREVKRLLLEEQGDGELRQSRFAAVSGLVDRLAKCQPVGALGLTEEAMNLAREWWQEDQAVIDSKISTAKKLEAREQRSAAARFLDELTTVFRERWRHSTPGLEAAVWADGLDQVRRTRHYILRNANTQLALNVLFGRLISASKTSANRR